MVMAMSQEMGKGDKLFSKLGQKLLLVVTISRLLAHQWDLHTFYDHEYFLHLLLLLLLTLHSRLNLLTLYFLRL